MTVLAERVLARKAAERAGDGIVRVGIGDLLAMRGPARHLTLKGLARHAHQSGGRRSQFRARGMDYEESRRYQIGDDMRNLDWRVMARTGKPYTKLFREERERPVFVCLDLGASMFFATRGVFKSVMAARCAALLSWAVLEHGDRVGGIVFGTRRQLERRPVRGKQGVLRLLNDIADDDNWDLDEHAVAEDLKTMASRIARVARPGSLVVVISDFRDVDDAVVATLRQIAVHSDLLNVFVSDPLERNLPAPGRYPISDRGRRWVLDSRSRRWRERHHQRFSDRLGRMESLYNSTGARCVHVGTEDDPARVLGETLRGVLR